jgi:enoyl-CoA hydratase/carnithine racemase
MSRSVVVTGAGGNFCSGGDVHEIIGPLTKMTMPELLEFTRMTGNLVKTMRNCPQPDRWARSTVSVPAPAP